jgi:tetratricopeptide (TPR) repeat protein
VLVPDPVRQELDLLMESGLSFELRGVRALEANDYKKAEEFFRKGIPLAPGDTMLGRSLRHKLATALVLQGDVRGAFEQFTDVVKLAPVDGPDETASKAHYSLGVLMASAGRGREAIEHFQSEAALPQYAEVVRLNPRAGDARFGYAMALVRLNRYRQAREWLAESTRLLPDDMQLRHALARILAAAPDAAARDGGQALSLTEQLLSAGKTTQVGETLAMAYAEVGNFAEATAIQRSVLDAAASAKLGPDVRRITANLRLYERRQACRTPWQPDEAVFSPGPPIDRDLAGLLSPGRS